MDQSVYTYYHTHWDREWYLPFRVFQHRLLKVVDDVLDAVESGVLPNFTLDGQTVLLEDYLEFRPVNRERLERLIRSDQISIGPWYVMPDEFLVSGESLIRNLKLGMEIARTFGETTFTGYLPDTFGHSADIPMILRHFGIDSAIVWRGVRPRFPLFQWQSPSGDSVLAYHLTQGYFQNAFHMGQTDKEKAEAFQCWLQAVRQFAPSDAVPILFPIGADHLGAATEAPGLMQQLAPQVKAITPDRFMSITRQQLSSENLDVLSGELYDFEGPYLLPGVYSSRMVLKQWNRRLEWRLTRQLEQLLVWQALLGEKVLYRHELVFLWKMLLLNHPHDSICGCSVDSVHLENENRFEQVDQLSQAMIREAHQAVRQHLHLPGTILILNLADAPYTGAVEIEQDYPLSQPIPVPQANSQVISEEIILDESFLNDTSTLPLAENRALRRRSLIFVSHVPPHGIQRLVRPEAAEDSVQAQQRRLQNSFLRVEVRADDDLEVEDRRTGRIYRGFHQLWRNVEQGDSYNAAPVPGAAPERAYLTQCEIVDSGPLRGTLRLEFAFPLAKMSIETRLSLNASSNRLDFRTRFVNQVPDQKIQVLFQADQPMDHLIAEGHFSPVTRTYQPDYRIREHMPAPAQRELPVQSGAIQRFIGFQEQTLITEGLTEYEVEGALLKLTLMRAFGMLSRDDTGVRGGHAGPPLPTPEGECLHHAFECRYAWMPGFQVEKAFHQADWFYGAIYGFDRASEGEPPHPATEEQSFFSWDNPRVHATATTPGEGFWQLRLLNPTPEPQSVTLKLPGAKLPLQELDLTDRPVAAFDGLHCTMAPYQIKTLQIAIE